MLLDSVIARQGPAVQTYRADDKSALTPLGRRAASDARYQAKDLNVDDFLFTSPGI